MANKDGKFGLRPVRKLSGGNICTSNYDIATAYATAIYTGDVVELTGTGLNIQKAAATNEDNLGVFAGCRYVTAAGKPVWSAYWPGVSDGKTDIVVMGQSSMSKKRYHQFLCDVLLFIEEELEVEVPDAQAYKDLLYFKNRKDKNADKNNGK